ncbi:hypothetical protein [Duganella sp. P38]|uniref:hypothetical protein n=1 Tax=Duganella sp. P38 TaxID=3423949 RepID=UPI003D7A9CE9
MMAKLRAGLRRVVRIMLKAEYLSGAVYLHAAGQHQRRGATATLDHVLRPGATRVTRQFEQKIRRRRPATCWRQAVFQIQFGVQALQRFQLAEQRGIILARLVAQLVEQQMGLPQLVQVVQNQHQRYGVDD